MLNLEKYVNSPHNYNFDLLRAREIGSELRLRLADRFPKKMGQAARIFDGLTGLAYTSAFNEITEYCNGGLATKISPSSATPQAPVHLRRLAIFYQILGIAEDDPIVAATKELNPKFEYPVQMPNRQIPAATLQVSFSGRRYALKAKQLKHLEFLASLYAAHNKTERKRKKT